MINAIFGVTKTFIQSVRDLRQQDRSTLTRDEKLTLRAVRDIMDNEGAEGWWKTTGTIKKWVVIDVLATEDEVRHLKQVAGADLKFLRVFYPDGTQFGQTFDDEGTELTPPTYNISLDNVLGDKTLRDIDGNVTGTETAALNEMPQWMGWKRS